ncbi:acetylxylan esterase [Pseudarthrobacter sp. SL88]|uniref:acetylxylan esterase n=1 Tax=Micrococcaceae TaxID=1268 RepID=UPI0006FF0839|nr:MULTISPECIES: acetylxylan esterase [Micrococcaceae]KQQ83328.1 acetyl esterase [Arthrobacter sp. Leaf137]MCY1673363.1 acetylxylan esterase [Pseudarthrobacter sp. SL88]
MLTRRTDGSGAVTKFPYSKWFPAAHRDGSYGYETDGLLSIQPVEAPANFASLWKSWYRQAVPVPASVRLTEVAPVEGRRVYEIEHAATGGLRLRGWLAMPAGGGEPRAGVVHGHGYGGREAVDFSRVPGDAAVMFALARGQGRLNAGLGAPLPEDGHVLFGIESIDTYVLGRCAVDIWHAASALTEVVGDVPLYYVGESFGGGIGALAVPWDRRFVGATLVVPSFGHYDLRNSLACDGSGERVRSHVQLHPEAREVLRYFDASTAATFLKVPVRVECALWDNHVPPPGQFAVANGVACASSQGLGAELDLDIQPAGHVEYPGIQPVRQAAYAATKAHLGRSLEGAARRA